MSRFARASGLASILFGMSLALSACKSGPREDAAATPASGDSSARARDEAAHTSDANASANRGAVPPLDEELVMRFTGMDTPIFSSPMAASVLGELEAKRLPGFYLEALEALADAGAARATTLALAIEKGVSTFERDLHVHCPEVSMQALFTAQDHNQTLADSCPAYCELLAECDAGKAPAAPMMAPALAMAIHGRLSEVGPVHPFELGLLRTLLKSNP